MWNADRQQRLDALRELEGQRALTDPERAELSALVEDRIRFETAAIEAATQDARARVAALAEETRRVDAQNAELEALIQEQETYLLEVQALIARLEGRRRDWRERYAKVTGKPLSEPVSADRGG